MRSHISVVTTKEDLLNYFKPEDPSYGEDAATWRTAEREGKIIARSDYYVVEMNPKSIQFGVEITAHEDPSDSDYGVTDAPMEFITDFLKTGTAGDEALAKMAGFPPEAVSYLLFKLADHIEAGGRNQIFIQKVLRRILVSIEIPFMRRLFAAIIKTAAREEIEEKEIADLKSQMEKKGWKVEQTKSDIDLPQLTVDVSGIYEAKIAVDSIVWDCSYEVAGVPESKTDEVTDDPIASFKKWRHSDQTKSSKKEAEARVKKKKEAPSEERTIPPPRRKPPSE